MNAAYLLIGGNLGDRLANLHAAKEAMAERFGQATKASAVYETAAWGLQHQPAFLNQAVEISTPLRAEQVLEQLLQIERSLGRIRNEKYGPRLIDIDILLFNNEVIDRPGLKVPHPQMPNRRFVLTPLNEIAADIVHPVLQKTVAQILADCPDPLSVNKIS